MYVLVFESRSLESIDRQELPHIATNGAGWRRGKRLRAHLATICSPVYERVHPPVDAEESCHALHAWE